MERRYPERFYEPNFPVVFADEHAQFETLCQDIADRIADVEGSSSAAPVMSPGPRPTSGLQCSFGRCATFSCSMSRFNYDRGLGSPLSTIRSEAS
jgi:hypothetical protein